MDEDLPRLYNHTYSTCDRPRRKRKLPETYRGMVRRSIEYPNGVLVLPDGKVVPLSTYTNCIPDDSKLKKRAWEQPHDDTDFVPEAEEEEEEEISSSSDSDSEYVPEEEVSEESSSDEGDEATSESPIAEAEASTPESPIAEAEASLVNNES